MRSITWNSWLTISRTFKPYLKNWLFLKLLSLQSFHFHLLHSQNKSNSENPPRYKILPKNWPEQTGPPISLPAGQKFANPNTNKPPACKKFLKKKKRAISISAHRTDPELTAKAEQKLSEQTASSLSFYHASRGEGKWLRARPSPRGLWAKAVLSYFFSFCRADSGHPGPWARLLTERPASWPSGLCVCARSLLGLILWN